VLGIAAREAAKTASGREYRQRKTALRACWVMLSTCARSAAGDALERVLGSRVEQLPRSAAGRREGKGGEHILRKLD